MEYRLLEPNDAEMLAAIRLESLKLEPEAFGSSLAEAEQVTIEEWQARLSPDNLSNSGYVGAFADGELIGIIGYFRHKGEKLRHKAALVSMYVRRSYRGSGAASGLIQTVLTHLRTLGDIQQAQLAVVTANQAAVRLYEKMGFQPYGLEKNALKAGDRYLDETLMYIFL
ncbi:GNAT family N-acetyltransferase [Brevibacillus sp. TJ4]|uniref:GNAT family N-acetyltransferase n=1 Tax=Brevibacillus sp. TJ4 TaxID=3234853 RepID=UPI0037D5C3AD